MVFYDIENTTFQIFDLLKDKLYLYVITHLISAVSLIYDHFQRVFTAKMPRLSWKEAIESPATKRNDDH